MSVFKRPALDVLAELRRGKAKNDMTDKLHDLIQAVRDTGKKGELHIKLVVTPLKNDKSQVDVTDVIVVKTPGRDLPSSRFFLTDDNNLTREDPQQETFSGLQTVKTDDESQAN
jgi:hypothetical protein